VTERFGASMERPRSTGAGLSDPDGSSQPMRKGHPEDATEPGPGGLRRNPDEEDDASARTCIATRAVRPPEEMLRFVRAPDGQVVPDIRRELPGRGVWVTATAEAVRQAVKRKAFGRSFRAEVTVDPQLAEVVDRLLAEAALQSLAMANKAGRVVAGFGKVESALRAGEAVALLHAADAAADGKRKLA